MSRIFRALSRSLRLGSLVLLAGCSSATQWDDAPAAKPVPVSAQSAATDLPRSKRGNPPFYEVYGVRYTVMDSSHGYRERGVASWYGKKFHGRDTSSGERYNMYAMTAAHKTLPLPTNVRVTNLENGKSIIVRVNDRGPFVKNRLIDLSYAAAAELGVIANGTAMVEVTALNSSTNYAPTTAKAGPVTAAPNAANESGSRSVMYLQVGAFGERANAHQLANRLTAGGISNVQVQEFREPSATLYKVRIGPLKSVSEFDNVSRKVEGLRIAEAHLVVETSG